MTKICIIGAGPVGLWTAIQIKSQQQSVKITIIEKYQEYKRKHPLKLELNALNSIAIPLDARYKNAIETMQTNIISKGNKKWNIASGKYINIRTNDLEKELKDTAIQLGIEIKNQAFKSIDELPQDVDYIIGADGAHSKVRKIVCDNEENNTDRKTLQYVVEVKYEATSTEEGQDKIELKSLKTKYPTQKLMHFFTDDYVGKPNRDNKYPVSVRFIIDKETYDALGDAGFKSPKGIDDVQNLPEKLRQDMAIWLNARRKYGEKIEDPSTIKITKLPLQVYKSKSFAKVDNNNKFIGICGDAAGAVPYFRALNGGLERASMLSKMITDHIRNGSSDKIKLAETYNSKMHSSLKWEIIRAILKDLILNIVRFFIYISGCVPWQVNKWGKKDREGLKTQSLFQDLLQNQNSLQQPLLVI